MKTKLLRTLKICAGTLAVTAVGSWLSFAQTTTTWNGLGGDTDWNNVANWDFGLPGEGTNALITAGYTVDYTAPMAAAGFDALSCAGVLNIGAPGFVVNAAGDGAIGFITSGAKLYLNSGAEVSTPNGGITLSNAAALSVSSGASLHVGGNLLFGRNGTGNTGFGTNNGGTISAAATSVNPNNNSSSSLLRIDGGTNDLGAVTVKRSNAGSGSYSSFGSEGLIINDGLVRMTSLDVGGSDGNSFLTTAILNGAVTNTGDMIVRQGTSGRGSRFLQSGGVYVCSGTTGVNLRGHSANNVIVVYSVTGGTNLVTGFLLGNPAATDTTGTIRLTNAARIYLGSAGMSSAGTLNTKTIALNSTGIFGAQADWSGTEPILLGGGAFDAADLDGVAHNITLSGALSGSGALNKIGPGTLTLDGVNTYSGSTLIHAGTLTLGASGSIANSPEIMVESSAIFDVSAAGGFTVGAARTLGGAGSVVGDVAVASGGIVDPGSSPGTLTLGNSLTVSGGAVLHFDLSTTPGPGNDLLVINGDLNSSGANTIEIVGGGSAGTVHTLIQYGGSFNGTLADFSISGASGTLSNNAVTKTISVIIQSSVRGPGSVVWVGNDTENVWDTVSHTNWLNTGTGLIDYFVAGDNARFDATGAAHPNVSIIGNVAPATVTVDAAANYTFEGSGGISGDAVLLKTNTGTLTINSTNTYTGVTIIGGGVLEASSLGNAGFPSAIGAGSAAADSLVLGGGTLRYTGDSVTSGRNATLNEFGGAIDVATDTTVLTANGNLTGAGALTKAGPGTLTLAVANSYSGGTVISNGTLRVNVFGAAGSAGVTNYGKTLLVGSAITFGNQLTFEGDCTVDLNNVGGNTALDGAWAGSGTVNIINQQNSSRTFTIGGNGEGGGNLWDFSGTINMGTNDGTLRFNDGGGTGSGPNYGSSNAVMNLGTGSAILVVRNGGTTTYLGALLGGSSTKLSGRSSSSGIATYAIGGTSTDALFEGIIEDKALPSDLTAIRKVGAGKWTLTGSSTYTGTTTVEEGTLQVDGALGNTAVSVIGGALTGQGSIAGPVDVQFGARLAPGAPVGQLAIYNTLLLGYGCTNIMELDKGLGVNDSIAGLTSITFGGSLIVTNLSGTLADGDTFYLFPGAGSYSGAFDSMDLPALDGGLNWNTYNLAVNGSISVVSGAPRPLLGITRFGNDLQFSWTGSFKLQSQTNSLSVGLSNNWLDYPGGDVSPVTVPLDSTAPTVFFRLSSP